MTTNNCPGCDNDTPHSIGFTHSGAEMFECTCGHYFEVDIWADYKGRCGDCGQKLAADNSCSCTRNLEPKNPNAGPEFTTHTDMFLAGVLKDAPNLD